ncbi:hypothetical protein [Rhizobacter sp. SG703]|uniref:hypothetical protein n=1 Tax=Rhizobacter sp. SG703 TaxID=2587140 RepID=UPI00144680A0|nr:hypothetical protein [Rhizobacter sp. SG703]NKI94466.1 hypothetical protein [Rhizobacter sp. SG703]
MKPDDAPTSATSTPSTLPDDWQALHQAERLALQARRRSALGLADDADHPALALPTVGLALSGGGVRSATFALGLLRGLAQNRGQQHGQPNSERPDPADRSLVADGMLGRVDYLSTVSGGGYTGAMFGRLVQAFGLPQAQALLARSDSPVLQWLRRNGRYLSPAGSRDIGIAVVTYLRAWLAIHTEFMFACMLLGLLVIAPHLAQHSTQLLDPQGWERWFTPWWPVALSLWAATAPGLVAGYWAARDSHDPNARAVGPGWRDMVFVAAMAIAAWLLLRALRSGDTVNPVHDALDWATAALLALLSIVVGQLFVQARLALGREPHALAVARLRNQLTRWLKAATLVVVAIGGMGALDRASWWVLEELQSGNQWLWGGVGFGGLVVLVLRRLAQPLQQMAAEAGARARGWLPRLMDVGSLVGLLALVTAWLVVLQWFVFAPDTFSALREVPAWMRALLVGGLWLGWIVLTAGNAQMANTSSLHSFYRARLTRAYLAVGNPRRGLAGGPLPRGDGTRQATHDVTSVVDGDDSALDSYRPETRGGPIHLVGTCLNQTRDDQSGLYNADRKGTAVTATWRGLEIGPAEFVALQPGDDTGTLGRWIAVSGAAASPGAGSYTSRGLALLVYFLGVRLGHWVRAPRESVQLRWLSRLAWRFAPKPLMLASEASATFYGVERPWWYLSDGGHFENSGIYPLLKRETDFMVLADASCDGDYSFGDIENLVRKARIDFGAEIDFYTREEAQHLFSLAGSDLTVLSPEQMADNHSSRGVLLARVRYRERVGPRGPWRPEATLLVVKPNLHDALDVDLLAYARQHERFPHESTGDQSFDEAQWESYHRLGEDFGRALHDTWLAQLPGWRSPARHGLRVAARLRSAADDAAAGAKAEPLWRRAAKATAITTTIGVGASGTLLLSVWQVQEQLQRNRVDQQTEARALFTEVSKALQDFNGRCPKVAEHVVTQASLLFDLRGSPAMRPLERAGVERLAGRIADECRKDADPSADCVAASQRLRNDLCAVVQKPPTENTAFSYWHPGTSPDEQAVAARRIWLALTGRASQLASAAQGNLPVPPPPSAPQADSPQRASLGACRQGDERSTLYIEIYDEASREAASALRQAIQQEADVLVQVAPIDNAARNAELRQQRRPVPWPVPTFVLHDPASRECALALSRFIGEPWVTPTRIDGVWIRERRRSAVPRPGVIELWLPPVLVAGQSAEP